MNCGADPWSAADAPVGLFHVGALILDHRKRLPRIRGAIKKVVQLILGHYTSVLMMRSETARAASRESYWLAGASTTTFPLTREWIVQWYETVVP